MKATPKTDEVISVLKQAVTAINLIEYNFKRIEKAGSTRDKAKEVINAYQSNLDYCNSCKITGKDVYDEYWELCTDIESLPKFARAMAIRFENIGIPLWVCEPSSDYQKQVEDKIFALKQQGYINKLQASDLAGIFDLLVDWVRMWVFTVQTILKEMGVEYKPIFISSTNKKERPHYNKDDEAKAKGQFQRLINGGYFLNETSLDDWLYIYGVKGKEPNKRPLGWQKTQIELAYMIRSIWQNTDTKIWAICKDVFTIKGEKPNIATMKSDLSSIDNKWKNRPESFDRLDEVLKG